MELQKYKNFVNEVVQQVRPHCQVTKVEEELREGIYFVSIYLTKIDFGCKMEFMVHPSDLKHKSRVTDFRDFIVINYQHLRTTYLNTHRSQMEQTGADNENYNVHS